MKSLSESYFISTAHMYAFILNHIDGKKRCELLGITEAHYEDREIATTWYHNIKGTLLSYTGDDLKDDIDKAMEKLKYLYDNMIGEDDELIPYAFVDGSYNVKTKTYGFGGFLVCNGKRYTLQGCGNLPDMVSMRNVAGEICGCREAVETAKRHGLKKLIIYYDYLGVEYWATGKWRRNKEATKEYHKYIVEAQKEIDIHFIKVKSHSNIPGNDKADYLAKQAVGLISKKK